MKVSPVSNPADQYEKSERMAALERALQAIAKQHNVTVEELTKSAQAAGPNGLPYMVRALNLLNRINNLKEE